MRERDGGCDQWILILIYNYFMPLDLQSIINYLFGLACLKSLGEEKDRETEKRRKVPEQVW